MGDAKKTFADLKEWASRLDREILNAEIKEALLGPAKNMLRDADKYLAEHGKIQGEELLLALVAEQLRGAQSMLSKYGPNMRVSG